MTDAVIVAIIGGSFGLLSLVYTAWASGRRHPSRRTTDQINLVDAGGKVIGNLTDEIDRLEKLADEALLEADGARTEARACRDENRKLRARVENLEDALRRQGIDPGQI